LEYSCIDDARFGRMTEQRYGARAVDGKIYNPAMPAPAA